MRLRVRGIVPISLCRYIYQNIHWAYVYILCVYIYTYLLVYFQKHTPHGERERESETESESESDHVPEALTTWPVPAVARKVSSAVMLTDKTCHC